MWSLICAVSSVQIMRYRRIPYQRPLTWGASSAGVPRRCVASFTLRCFGLGMPEDRRRSLRPGEQVSHESWVSGC